MSAAPNDADARIRHFRHSFEGIGVEELELPIAFLLDVSSGENEAIIRTEGAIRPVITVVKLFRHRHGRLEISSEEEDKIKLISDTVSSMTKQSAMNKSSLGPPQIPNF